MRLLSWNLLDFTGLHAPAEARDPRDQVAVIRSRRPAVCAVQEILGPPATAADRLAELADACGMRCELDPHRRGNPAPAHAAGTVALGVADTLCNTGLMWDPEQIEFQEGSFDSIGRARGGFWHALAVAEFLTKTGVRLRIGSWLANPFDGLARYMEIPRLGNAMERDTVDGCVLAGDFNLISAVRGPDGGFFDDDPYTDVPWYDGMDYQVLDEPGPPWRADRRAGRRLLRRAVAGWTDTAVLAGGPAVVTTGHWAADPHPPRRPDAVLVTRRLAEAGTVMVHRTLRDVRIEPADGGERVIDVRTLSDHLPVEVDFAFAT